jgi:hypothetical protein
MKCIGGCFQELFETNKSTKENEEEHTRIPNTVKRARFLKL